MKKTFPCGITLRIVPGEHDMYLDMALTMLEAILPVSYTHLDVYKRQAYHLP